LYSSIAQGSNCIPEINMHDRAGSIGIAGTIFGPARKLSLPFHIGAEWFVSFFGYDRSWVILIAVANETWTRRNKRAWSGDYWFNCRVIAARTPRSRLLLAVAISGPRGRSSLIETIALATCWCQLFEPRAWRQSPG
jgi:hypothetical protein